MTPKKFLKLHPEFVEVGYDGYEVVYYYESGFGGSHRKQFIKSEFLNESQIKRDMQELEDYLLKE